TRAPRRSHPTTTNTRPVTTVVSPQSAATVAKAASGPAAPAPPVTTAAAAPARTAAGVSWTEATAPRCDPSRATAAATTVKLASARPMPRATCSGPAAPNTRVPTDTAIVTPTAAMTTAEPTSTRRPAGRERAARGREGARAGSSVTPGSASAERGQRVAAGGREAWQQRQRRPAGVDGQFVGAAHGRVLALVECEERRDHRRGVRRAPDGEREVALGAQDHEVARRHHAGEVRELRPVGQESASPEGLRADLDDAVQGGGEEREALTEVARRGHERHGEVADAAVALPGREAEDQLEQPVAEVAADGQVDGQVEALLQLLLDRQADDPVQLQQRAHVVVERD